MNVASLISAYHNHSVVKRFVDKILPFGDVFIHVDAKCDIRKFHDILGDSVCFCSKRKYVSWGGRSQIDACIELLQTARAKKNYDYYSIHSDTDYPVRKVSDYILYLEKHDGHNFIESFPVPEENIFRYEKYHLDDFFSQLKV